MHFMLSVEFLDRFRSGQKEFENILLQYCDLGGNDFCGLNLKNSKLLFVYMRNCNFEDAVFENCEMSFVGFRGSNFKNVVLRGCRIEYFGMSVITHNTRMINCTLDCGEMLEANQGEINSMNCTESRVFRTLNEDALKTLGSIFSEIGPLIQQLDFDMQGKIRSLIDEFKEKVQYKQEAAVKGKNTEYGKAAKTGYGPFDSIMYGAIAAYEKSPEYLRKKDSYERKDAYGR